MYHNMQDIAIAETKLRQDLIAYLDHLVVAHRKPITILEREYKIRNLYSRLQHGDLPNTATLLKLCTIAGYTDLTAFLVEIERYSLNK